MKVHTMFVIGKRDLDAHDKGNLAAKPCAETIADVVEAIKTRRAS